MIDGEPRTLRLTLGALAELEERLGGGDFATLAERLERPRLADLLVILEALTAGGGARLPAAALKASDLNLPAAAAAVAAAFRTLKAAQ
jgi:hypothetical protein